MEHVGTARRQQPEPAAPALCPPQSRPEGRSYDVSELWLCLCADDVPVIRLAMQACALSPRVSLEDDEAVLVEIGAGLRALGGMDACLMRLPSGVRWAVAPTPRAALWLSRAAPGARVTEVADLRGILGRLPLAALALPIQAHRRLHGFGVRTVRDLLRLPQAPLARRVGQAVIDAVQRALGERAEPRLTWSPPSRYRGRREAEYDIESTAMVAEFAAPLFAELESLCRALGRGVRRCTLVLEHRHAPPTRIRLGTLEAVQDGARLQAQAVLHLARTPLPEPATAVVLRAPRLEQMTPGEGDLFIERAGGEAWSTLIDRLRARLGATAVMQLVAVVDHRPERANLSRPVGVFAANRASQKRSHISSYRRSESVIRDSLKERPVWLFSDPDPVRRDRYQLLRGPERIESGWWDGHDVQRDYFVAADTNGARHWLFRERQPPHRWYLHGLFG